MKFCWALLERAGAEIRTGLTVSEIHDEPDRVTVTFSDGRVDSFDLLAGFDGIRSTTRAHLIGTAFVPRPSGYGAWRVQVPRPDYVRGMEFLQGVGSKTGGMPLSNELMYVFHIRPEEPDAVFKREDYPELFRQRLAQYGSYVAKTAARSMRTPTSSTVRSSLSCCRGRGFAAVWSSVAMPLTLHHRI